jgi:enoyl-CoA hydratase
MTALHIPSFTTLQIELKEHIGWLRLNRPEKANSINQAMWDELPQALAWLQRQTTLRVLVLTGNGRHFTAGIDLAILRRERDAIAANACGSRGREGFLDFIESAQHAFNAFENLRVPVIAAIQGVCIGGGVDLIAACDIRICSVDARFCVKEVDVGIVPDVGTIQRLRHVIGYSALTELSYTGETFDGAKAQRLGLVSQVCPSEEALKQTAAELAATIAAKPPVAVRGIKRNLLFSRDHSVADGLAYAAAWNAGMTMGRDLDESMAALSEKRTPEYRD